MDIESNSRRIRTGLIGCGKIATIHAMALNSLPEADFVACCDQDIDRARATAAKYDVPLVFDNAESLLREAGVEAVLICTPHPAHETLVVAAAKAGVHVLCEKPISVTVDAANRMVDAAKAAGTVFSVIFQRRFWPASQRARRAVESGKLGNLTLGECSVRIWRGQEYFASDSWRGKWETEGGGVLMNQAVHAIDLLQWLMGRPTEVFGQFATLRHSAYIDVEDTAVATLKFPNGGLATIQAATTVLPASGFRVVVHGDKGPTVSIWEVNEGEQGINDVWTLPGEDSFRAVWEWEEKDKPGFPLFHVLQIQEYLQSLLAGRQPAVTGEDARVSLEIIQAIYQSSRTGQPVHLD